MKKIYFLLFLFFFVFGSSQDVFDIARKGTLAELKELIKTNKELINEADSNSFSPLILACYYKNTEVAEFLIENVKDVNYLSNQGTALAGLCINYDKNLVIKLLQKSANPNIKDNNGVTPLIWAVKMGNAELVKILLQYGADKSLADNYNKTAFEYALEFNKTEIIQILKF